MGTGRKIALLHAGFWCAVAIGALLYAGGDNSSWSCWPAAAVLFPPMLVVLIAIGILGILSVIFLAVVAFAAKGDNDTEWRPLPIFAALNVVILNAGIVLERIATHMAAPGLICDVP